MYKFLALFERSTLLVEIFPQDLDLCEFARKLVPNFELLWKVRENKPARKFLIFRADENLSAQ